ncbi:leucine-rich repeat-containing protein 70-like [Cotesia glomerata]|uniref:leucine-rich repeat-containing protein 70-like n=1 Tax=Cotesia glomerata TaxID=32391 RepID=UPI001D01BB24|nr:leucine-rich repeat-containing protein 70-like [Cotesia glomerata]
MFCYSVLFSIFFCATAFCEIKNSEDAKIVMDFSNLGIFRVNNFFVNSSIVTHIYLSKNNILEIEKKAFDGLPNLVYLNLTGNLFSFSLWQVKHKNLETLVLDKTLRILGPRDFYFTDDCRMAKYYRKFPPNHQNSVQLLLLMPRLKELYLRGNNIVKIFGLAKERLPSLTHLYLSDNNISEADFIHLLPMSLTHLYLNKNNFSEISYSSQPFNISKDGSHFYTVELSLFFNLVNLQVLDLSYNNINRILDHTFENLTNLITLHLDYNNLSNVFNSSGLESLEYLSMSHNQIRDINQSFFGLPKLEKLVLNNNFISSISSETFDGLISLQELNLSGNSFKVLPENWISKINLRVLYLRDNLFENFDNLSVIGVTSLEYLNVGGNLLKLRNLKSLSTFAENITIDFGKAINEV